MPDSPAAEAARKIMAATEPAGVADLAVIECLRSIAGGNLLVSLAYGLSGEESERKWRNGVLAGAGLQFVLDEPT